MRHIEGYLFTHTDDAHVRRTATTRITDNHDGSYTVSVKLGATPIFIMTLTADHPSYPHLDGLMNAMTAEDDRPLLVATA